MALIFNNLMINKNSKRYRPFLFNLLSGRRRLLSDIEIQLVTSMFNKDIDAFDVDEKKLFDNLKSEKQFLTDESRALLEESMASYGYFNIDKEIADDFSFSVELTKNCNMQCSYCYVSSRSDKNVYLDEAQIDNIYRFYTTYADDVNKIKDTAKIGITGGEPLVSDEAVNALCYLSSKWPSAKIFLLTNGINLLKYYDKLPLSRIGEVQVSLDGTKEVHMSRRFSGNDVDLAIYDDIISGVKRLLNDGVSVSLATVVDKFSYSQFADFKALLDKQDISNYPNFSHNVGVVLDYRHNLDINDNLNNKHDVIKIQKHFRDLGLGHYPTFPSMYKLLEAVARPKNTPFLPKHQRCSSEILRSYYFACDGNVYFCDCPYAGEGVVGTYYPNISLDEDASKKLLNRSVMNHDKCKVCSYKFVCLGGCPLSARSRGEDMTCGAFADDEILDNLEYNYDWIPEKGDD